MIKLEQVSFSYSSVEKENLKNINLSIHDGECILLCGRSGCGKTTITRLINGLIPNCYEGQLTGNVSVNDIDIFSVPMYEIATYIGSVFQNPRTQFFNVDTDSEIVFGIENEAIPPDELQSRLNSTTDILKINHLKGRNIFELSGGEKQKIAFASVYAMNPNVYLLDEPSSNLDMDSINELKEHLRLIKKQGKTLIITEHRLYYLMDLIDKVIYLSNGEIKEIYTPNEFLHLSDTTRKSLGLRATDLNKVYLSKNKRKEMSISLEIKDVSLFYKQQPVMEHINLKVQKGEIIGIVGHNGAGKSTFLRTLCGLHKENTGDFIWEGKKQTPKERMKRSYMVMQDVNYELFTESVEAECSLGIRNPNKTLIEQTLRELDLISYREKHPNILSGGQKQRVAIAVSMICNKDLLVFDEPTSGLDFDSMEQVSKLIEKLAQNKIIFIVTHDYEFICRACSRIVKFHHGSIVNDMAISDENKCEIKKLFNLE